MASDVVRVELPDTVTPVPFEELRSLLKDMEDSRYPAKIVLYCDECGRTVSVEIVVTDAVSSPQRLAMGRAWLRTRNWQADESGDFCPAHKEES